VRIVIVALLMATTVGCAAPGGKRATGENGKIHIAYETTKLDAARGALTLNVYRSDRFEGPFARANQKPISVAVGGPADRKIVFTDRKVEIGRDYFYYLTEATPEGGERKIVPVTRARAVLPSGAEERNPP